jgi:hypothetical protein
MPCSPHLQHPASLRLILILSFHIRLIVSSGNFPSSSRPNCICSSHYYNEWYTSRPSRVHETKHNNRITVRINHYFKHTNFHTSLLMKLLLKHRHQNKSAPQLTKFPLTNFSFNPSIGYQMNFTDNKSTPNRNSSMNFELLSKLSSDGVEKWSFVLFRFFHI